MACREVRTYNRPFVRHCRRCGRGQHQVASLEEARRDGWGLAPHSASEPEVVADLSGWVDTGAPPYYSFALEVIGGAVAVHLAGHFLALLRPCPKAEGEAFLWVQDSDPISSALDDAGPGAYPPGSCPATGT